MPRKTMLAVVIAATLALIGTLLGVAPIISTAQFIDTTTSGSNTLTAGALADPTGVSAGTGSTVTVTWTASVSTQATGYHIYRSATSGTLGPLVATVTPRTATSWVDNAPLDGPNYYVVRTYLQNWESGTVSESTGTGVYIVIDNFNSTGALGTTEQGSKTWQEINGTWTRNGSGLATTATGAASNPMAVVNLNSGDVDVRTDVYSASGEALYFRVVDGDDWLRARYQNQQSSYYVTEYQHPTYSTEYQHPTYTTEYQHPTYATEMQISRQYRQNEGWGPWVYQSQTACRIGEPALPATTNDAWGYQYTAYRYTPGGTVNCTGSQAHYNLEKATATTTFSAITYPWVASGYAMTYDRYTHESDTGNRRQGAQNGSYWDTNSGGTVLATRQTQTGSYWDFNSGGTVLATRQTQTGSYWDTNSGGTVLATRQAGPYYQYDHFLRLEKSVAGTVTSLGSWNVSGISNFRVTAQGTTITLYRDTTVTVATVTDATHQTATLHGLGLGGSDTYSPGNSVTYFWGKAL